MVQSFHLRITSLGWQWLCLELWVEKDSECHDELMMSARGAGRDVTACVSGIFSSLIDPSEQRFLIGGGSIVSRGSSDNSWGTVFSGSD